MGVSLATFSRMNEAVNKLLSFRAVHLCERITLVNVRKAQKDVYIILNSDLENSTSSCTADEILRVVNWLGSGKESGSI